MRINEIFGPTIQGEGKSAGRRVIFIRLSMCNLHCSWCDTPYTWNWEGTNFSHPLKFNRELETHEMTVSEIVQEVKSLGVKSVVVISPYPNNDDIVTYLTATGVKVARDVALCLPVSEYSEVTPSRWQEIARENDVQNADAIFLSCAATTQIEAVAAIEKELGKSVVNSNQSVLWGVLKRLKPKLGSIEPMPHLGSLMQTL